MAGESPEHGAVRTNLTVEVGSQLRGARCQASAKDMRVRSGPLPRRRYLQKGLYSYPDLLVVCGELQFLDENRDVIINPKSSSKSRRLRPELSIAATSFGATAHTIHLLRITWSSRKTFHSSNISRCGKMDNGCAACRSRAFAGWPKAAASRPLSRLLRAASPPLFSVSESA